MMQALLSLPTLLGCFVFMAFTTAIGLTVYFVTFRLHATRETDEAMKEKFFKNMSKRAAEMLRDDLDAKGPVRLSEVEMAQKEILGIARRLAEEGQVALGGKSGEQFV